MELFELFKQDSDVTVMSTTEYKEYTKYSTYFSFQNDLKKDLLKTMLKIYNIISAESAVVQFCDSYSMSRLILVPEKF